MPYAAYKYKMYSNIGDFSQLKDPNVNQDGNINKINNDEISYMDTSNGYDHENVYAMQHQQQKQRPQASFLPTQQQQQISSEYGQNSEFLFGRCKVCMDMATGIHYSVATCEGCKVGIEFIFQYRVNFKFYYFFKLCLSISRFWPLFIEIKRNKIKRLNKKKLK
jgi:hypothetical protein